MRLTQNHKNTIVRNVIDATLSKRRIALGMEESNLANEIADYAIGEKNLKLMAQLPKTYFKASSTVGVSLEGHRDYTRLKLSEARYLPNFYHGTIASFQTKDHYHKRIDDLLDAKEKYNTDLEDIKISTQAILDSSATLKKLLVNWPDCRKFIPDTILNPVKKQEIALPIDQLNQKIAAFAA